MANKLASCHNFYQKWLFTLQGPTDFYSAFAVKYKNIQFREKREHVDLVGAKHLILVYH